MSFTSVLPTPQVVLKSKPPPPIDIAKGFDELVSLTVSAMPVDSSKGEDALVQLPAALPLQLDSAVASDLPASAGASAYGYIMRVVRRGDIILPEDQNNPVYVWRVKLDALAKIESKLRDADPEKADTLAAYISELKAIVDRMPLVKEGDWVYAEHFNLHVRSLRKLVEIEEWMTTEIASGDPEMVQLLDTMKSFLQQVGERKSGDVVASADWNAVKQALSLAPRLNELAEAHAEELIPPTVYLFNGGDWSTAKNYVTDGALIFCMETIDTLPSSDVEALVKERQVVFVVMVDTGPFYSLPAPAFYPVFYRVLRPPYCGFDIGNVTDSCFRLFLGSSVPALIDYCVSLSYKVSGARNWTGDSCGWGYKKYEKGAIVEVPCDGIWKSADWLGKYVDAISNCLLGQSKPRRILYLSGYISDVPDWHECHPMDACWSALCAVRGWKLVDLR